MPLNPGDACPKCFHGKISKKPRYMAANANRKFPERPGASLQIGVESLEYSCEDCGWAIYLRCKEQKREESNAL